MYRRDRGQVPNSRLISCNHTQFYRNFQEYFLVKQDTIIRPAPPPDMVAHMIAYLNRRIASLKPGEKGPGVDWLPWLVDTDKALKEAQTVKIEILGRSDLEKFLSIDE